MLCVVLLSVLAADTPTLRALCLDTPTIVVADVVDPLSPTQFRVTQSLRGKLKPGDTLNPTNLRPEAMRTFDEPDFENDRKPRPRRVERALLFLDADGAVRDFRLATEDGRVMAFREGKPQLVASRWAILLTRVAGDVATVDRLLRSCRIPSAQRRTAAIVNWIERHRDDFRSVFGGTDEAPTGWGPLRTRLFDALYETGDPASAWVGVRLHARLFDGELLKPRSDVFLRPNGKTFLRKIVADTSMLSGDRIRAIELLGPDEALRGLLGDPQEQVQVAVVQALTGTRDEKDLDALVEAWKAAPQGQFRSELAWALAQSAPSRWSGLTKNHAGFCAVLREPELDSQGLRFWLHAKSPEGKITEPPLVVLEQLTVLGLVQSTKSSPLSVLVLPRDWSEGWDGSPPLPAHVDFSGLQPSTRYRLRIEGTIGPKKQKWLSEPYLFTTPGVIDDSPSGRGRRDR
jgi:hypothetical protein